MVDYAEMVAYIRQAAIDRGIDPNVAVQVANNEGLPRGSNDPTLQSYVKTPYGREQSYGPYQLNTRDGMGRKMINQTGLDPRNPQNWKAGVDYALNEVARSGWTGAGIFGARDNGIGNWQGIGKGAGARAISRPSLARSLGIDTGGRKGINALGYAAGSGIRRLVAGPGAAAPQTPQIDPKTAGVIDRFRNATWNSLKDVTDPSTGKHYNLQNYFSYQDYKGMHDGSMSYANLSPMAKMAMSYQGIDSKSFDADMSYVKNGGRADRHANPKAMASAVAGPGALGAATSGALGASTTGGGGAVGGGTLGATSTASGGAPAGGGGILASAGDAAHAIMNALAPKPSLNAPAGQSPSFLGNRNFNAVPSAGNYTDAQGRPVLSEHGSHPDYVNQAQDMLKRAMPWSAKDLTPGKYDAAMKGQVMALQAEANKLAPHVKVDGVIGPQTWSLGDMVSTARDAPGGMNTPVATHIANAVKTPPLAGDQFSRSAGLSVAPAGPAIAPAKPPSLAAALGGGRSPIKVGPMAGPGANMAAALGGGGGAVGGVATPQPVKPTSMAGPVMQAAQSAQASRAAQQAAQMSGGFGGGGGSGGGMASFFQQLAQSGMDPSSLGGGGGY